jgi:hypothetical protein
MSHAFVPRPAPRELRCIECDEIAAVPADGWKAYIGGGYEGEPLEVLIYCPACAQREFGDGQAA